MNPFISAVMPFVRRRRVRDVTWGVCIGAAIGAGVFGAFWWGGGLVGWGLGGAFVSAVVGGIVGRRVSPGVAEVCSLLDADFGLKERLRTAYELKEETSPLATLQRRDALHHLATKTPQEWIPRRFPRWGWGVPMLYGVVSLLFLLLPRGTAAPDPERVAVRRAVEALRPKVPQEFFRAEELERARNAREALAVLADLEARLKATSPAADALATARETLQSGVPRGTSSLAEALDAARLSDALREELRTLRERLSRQESAASLREALERIETQGVSAETLKRLVAALRELEKRSDAELLNALEEIRAQKKAIAAVALESRRGSIARLDATPGRESEDVEAKGSRLPSFSRPPEAGVLTLEGLLDALGREVRVYSEKKVSPSNPERLVPFQEVVLASRQEAERFLHEETLPLAYRGRIAAYFSALSDVSRRERP